MSTKVLVVAEILQGELQDSTARAVTAAADLSPDTLDVLVLSDNCAGPAQQAASINGVSKALTVERAENAHAMAATFTPQIVAAVEQGDYTHVLVPNTTFGKDLTPRVAAKLGVAMVTDLAKVIGPHEFERPIYAGNAVTTVETPDDQVLVASVRCASYNAADSGDAAAVEALDLNVDLPTHTRYVGMETQGDGGRPDLASAPKVVSGGRGVGSEENFKIIYDFADKIGAGVGASRAAVDSGFVPNDMQVGQTGKVIAPDLYMCFGISGAIQHLAGIKDAGTIVAVNKDEEAPIFEVADFGLVADLFQAIPEIESALG